MCSRPPIANWLQESEPVSNIVQYILFRAAERFREQHGRYPGADDDADLEADTALLKRAAAEMLTAWGVPGAEQVEERVADFAKDFMGFWEAGIFDHFHSYAIPIPAFASATPSSPILQPSSAVSSRRKSLSSSPGNIFQLTTPLSLTGPGRCRQRSSYRCMG
ncbi:hypothetical protein BC937DRAFT_92958 [Endogone sp. FLAS-F59071]|nr:hypothetical protein BC937DRAFT_92958 [Endogone sp. FLAS-F59071]|eukprot:RUS15056.1 hypothetical protein BC937DRAFT_92958 [Endogone sp. FLAS-F59071]